jgi:hypothetical protein
VLVHLNTVIRLWLQIGQFSTPDWRGYRIIRCPENKPDRFMQLDTFFTKLNEQPETIDFAETMAVIEANYHFTPSAFNNGEIKNAPDQNNGSCKLFAFAQLHGLNEQQTLACFGQYYRDDVLKNPQGRDHQNIRHFMQSGWQGIVFSQPPLSPIHT